MTHEDKLRFPSDLEAEKRKVDTKKSLLLPTTCSTTTASSSTTRTTLAISKISSAQQRANYKHKRGSSTGSGHSISHKLGEVDLGLDGRSKNDNQDKMTKNNSKQKIKSSMGSSSKGNVLQKREKAQKKISKPPGKKLSVFDFDDF